MNVLNALKAGFSRRLLALWLVVAIFATACSSDGGSGGGASNPPTAIPADAIKVTFTYGSEKDAWVKAVTQTFNQSNQRTASGKLIVAEPIPVGSTESAYDIVEGRAQPALWSPASRLLIPILNDEWLAKNGKEIVDPAECRDLVLSPIVIMMWRPMAEALGWPNQNIGWADIIKLATSPNGWADYGKPQFGKFRFGHTHPDYSNSGLQAIAAIAYAASGKQRGLTPDDVKAPDAVKFMQQVESSIAHYGRSTGFFGREMAARGTAYLSAAIVYENLVAENNKERGTRLEFPLVAIYPKEGTFQSDHPACIPDAPYMNADLKEAAGIYRNFLLANAQQQRALEFGFRPADTSIAIGAPLTRDFGVDPDQPKNTLSVPTAATLRAIREVWQQTKRKVNLTMLIDVSGSMREQDGTNTSRIQSAREGAKAFVDQLADEDTFTLITFSSNQLVLLENLPVGPNRDRIKREIDSLIAQGGTKLYDSIAFSIERMKLSTEKINALVVLSDGEDTESQRFTSPSTLMDRFGMRAEAAGPDVSIFTIGFGRAVESGDLQTILKTIASRGRGAFYKATIADISQIYQEISTFF